MVNSGKLGYYLQIKMLISFDYLVGEYCFELPQLFISCLHELNIIVL